MYCVFCFNFLTVLHIFCMQKEFHIHADLEFRRPLIIHSIRKIIPANDFIFAIDSSGVSVAFHQTEHDYTPFNCCSCRNIRRHDDWGSGIQVFRGMVR
jgi:hypothetical protein